MQRAALPILAFLALAACQQEPAAAATNPGVTPNATARLELDADP